MKGFEASGMGALVAFGLLTPQAVAQSPTKKPPSPPIVKLDPNKCHGLFGKYGNCSLKTRFGTVLLRLTPEQFQAIKGEAK